MLTTYNPKFLQTLVQWRSLKIFIGGSEVTGPKSIYLKKNFFYKTGGSKTYIPKKNLYETYIHNTTERKVRGVGRPLRPLHSYATALVQSYKKNHKTMNTTNFTSSHTIRYEEVASKLQ
ncbi:hypothetical protein HanRHA438_Chr15g0688351 [Helianthus annuus]|nr:hypothetical protein HanRHA438_Chr15g0688351 [Helianthus annuus]